MLIATQSTSIDATLKYFRTVLTQGDYYLGQEVGGTWNGKAADLLGLGVGSPVTNEQFTALLKATHPVTGEKIAQRIRKDRRPGVDFTFSVPKSVSLVWAINQDERIVKALREAVHETMTRDVEPLVCRRVRDGGKAGSMDRKRTGNLVYADFLHKTSRPVDGEADPHLHIHAYALNYTADEGQHYAAEMEEVMRQLPKLQAAFESRLARKLKLELGFAIEQVAYRQSGKTKHGWEIASVERSTIEKFSNRTSQVEAYAAEHGITEADAKAKLGLVTREAKDEGRTVEELREGWTARLTAEEKAVFESLRAGATGKEEGRSEAERIEKAVQFALEHHLYRQSTVEKHAVIATALEHSLFLSPEQVEAALDRGEVIHRSHTVRGAERDYVTTTEVLQAEQRLIEFARDGRGTRKPIGRQDHEFLREFLDDQQQAAVRHVLQSRDTVMAIAGGAGTGKTSLMLEACDAMKANGKTVAVFAPSTGAREVLIDKGFENAQTVAHLAKNERLQSQLKNQVMWVDEAGLLDVRSMNTLFDIAKAQNCRVVLSGDTRQHSSPRRGEAMRLIESEAGLDIARVEKIKRQKGQYRKAVELVSMGEAVIDKRSGMTGMLAGYDLLDRMGKIKEITGADRHAVLAKQYLAEKHPQKTPLVVAPTHAEGEALTAEIRSGLRDRGAIGKKDVCVERLRSLNWSEAEKGEARTYRHGDSLVVEFHQNTKGGFKRGERYHVRRNDDGEAVLQHVRGGPLKAIPLASADHFEVYTQQQVQFAKGDKIRFTLGGKAADGKRQISNGRIDTIKGFAPGGDLYLESGMIVSKEYGHIGHGYVVTSHAAQGCDKPLAIAAIGSQSLPAVNAKQFYVTVSRGQEDVAIYVDNKAAVRRAIQQAGEQVSATELVNGTRELEETIVTRRTERQRSFMDRVHRWWQSRFPQQQTSLGKAVAGSRPSGGNRKERAFVGMHATPELGRG